MRKEDALCFKDDLLKVVNAAAVTRQGGQIAGVASTDGTQDGKDALRSKSTLLAAGDVFPSAVRLQGNGPDDARPWLARLTARARMVCSISVPHTTLRGTGFLIGPDLVLTCFHVIRRAFENPALAGDLEIIFDREARADSTGHDQGVSYRLSEEDWLGARSEETGNGLDFAVLHVEGRPGDDRRGGPVRGWVNLGDFDTAVDGDFVATIHHPDDARLLFSFGSIASPPKKAGRLNHTARSFSGTSGAPILSFFGRIVAMHVGLPQGGTVDDPDSRLALPASTLLNEIKDKESLTRSPVD